MLLFSDHPSYPGARELMTDAVTDPHLRAALLAASIEISGAAVRGKPPVRPRKRRRDGSL